MPYLNKICIFTYISLLYGKYLIINGRNLRELLLYVVCMCGKINFFPYAIGYWKRRLLLKTSQTSSSLKLRITIAL